MKILLVDDDVFVRDMYVTKFQEAGHNVLPVDNPENALGILKKDSFDVILSDIVMPNMNGFQFVEQVRVIVPDMNIIILSNQSETTDKVQAKKLGVIDYLVKAEMMPGEVVKKVEALIAKKRI